MKCRSALGILVVAFVCAPAFVDAADITNGIDAWLTPSNGSSFASFADDPIPAGFFCPASDPFTGRIHWKGVPLATQPANALRGADTVVQRMDDLVFDADGRAVTRLQMRALSMESLAPIQTRCGAFNVRASLGAVQPLTTMEVVESRSGSGYWSAVLGINVKLTFTPVQSVSARQLTLDQAIELRVDRALWSDKAKAERPDTPAAGFVLVDTTGDQIPDTFLPGPSTFFAKGAEASEGAYPICYDPERPFDICHSRDAYGEYCHCVTDPDLIPTFTD